ncbi:hypothetical protein D3P08_17380 [Paenibacillus nanensis]|uniref:DUF6843 domain-containing protein n=1 Tax=Paenibacillus nanensis TaxID=393251 RepID=A0A3A1V112_9BACL|nr:hypothetical protein [Paenibacillus nanensis]RIX51240.1 hypothetical protein D3P08_17380 [Paenibacillus nanensis]
MAQTARSTKLAVLIIALLVVCIAAAVTLVLSAMEERVTHKYVIPQGFTGWVEVTYEQQGHPALKKEGRKWVYEIPTSGKLSTSSRNISGPMLFYYADQDGRLTEFPTDISIIHEVGASSGGSSSGEKYPEKVTFFVGTEEQWRASEKQ